MASILKLFTIIDSNNHEMLSELIKKNKKIVSQAMVAKQSGTYILPRAVKVRAKECFDLLLDIVDPESFILVTCDNETNTGVMQALKYCMAFPSQENKYYLEKLLDLGIPIAPCEVVYAVDNMELFMRLFDRLNTKSSIILKLVEGGNISAIEYALSWLIANGQLDEALTGKIIKVAINTNKLSVLKLLDSKGLPLLVCENRPSIYFVYNSSIKNKKHVEQLLDYLLDYYKKQPAETIRQIPGIELIDSIMLTSYYTCGTNNTYRYEIIKLLKAAGINTVSSSIVNGIYSATLANNLSNVKYIECSRMRITVIYSLLENNMISANITDVIKTLKTMKLVYCPTNFNIYNNNVKETYRGLYYVLSHFGVEVDLNDNDIKRIFNDFSIEDFNAKKTEFINGLVSELNPNKTTNKSPKKKSKNITL